MANLPRSVRPQTGRSRILSPVQSSGLAPVAQPPRRHTPRNVAEKPARESLNTHTHTHRLTRTQTFSVSSAPAETHRTEGSPRRRSGGGRAAKTTKTSPNRNKDRLPLIDGGGLTDEPSLTRSTRMWKSFSISMPFLWAQTNRRWVGGLRLGATARSWMVN